MTTIPAGMRVVTVDEEVNLRVRMMRARVKILKDPILRMHNWRWKAYYNARQRDSATIMQWRKP